MSMSTLVNLTLPITINLSLFLFNPFEMYIIRDIIEAHHTGGHFYREGT